MAGAIPCDFNKVSFNWKHQAQIYSNLASSADGEIYNAIRACYPYFTVSNSERIIQLIAKATEGFYINPDSNVKISVTLKLSGYTTHRVHQSRTMIH